MELKRPSTIDEQLDKLNSHGIDIDTADAKDFCKELVTIELQAILYSS